MMKYQTIVIITIALVNCSSFAAAEWQITTLDSATPAKQLGGSTSLKLDSAGYPHISYHASSPNEDLKYAYWSGTGWVIETVDSTGDVGNDNSLYLIGNVPNIAYYDFSNGTLKLAYKTGTVWNTPTIVSWGAGHYGYGIEPCIVGQSITYTDVDVGSLWSRDWTGEYFSNTEVDNCVPHNPSLAFDNNGDPTIVYQDGIHNQLKLVRMISGVWQTPVVLVDNPGGGYPSLAFDLSTGFAHVCYWDMGGGGLKYWTFTGTEYITETIDTGGGYMNSLALDSQAHPHVAYRDAVQTLKYAKRTASGWQITQVDPAQTDGGMGVSLALDVHNNPHIAWTEYNGALKYAVFIPSGIGVFRPSTHMFYLDWNGNGKWDGTVTDRAYNFGLSGDKPVSGDWSSRGYSSIGVFRSSTHMFYLDWSGNGVWNGAGVDRAYNFGMTGDLPVSGDWNNIGRTCIGVFRPSTHMFYLDFNGNGVWDGAGTDRAYTFGLNDDLPVSGDWNNIGRTCIGVFRPSTHTFYLDWNGNGKWDGIVADRAYTFGLSGDIPVTWDWKNIGTTRIGVFRPSSHTFYLDYNGNGKWDGIVTDRAYNFGLTDDKPSPGAW